METAKGVFWVAMRVRQCGRAAQRASRVAYFGKAEEEWRDLRSASTSFSPAVLVASRLALFSLFRSFRAPPLFRSLIFMLIRLGFLPSLLSSFFPPLF
jgi:hypothetical protein